MARHHVNHNTGNVGICKAAKGGCPFGGETGDDNHYDTPQEAQQAAEKLMAEQYTAVNAAYRKKDTSALEGMNREMKKRIISEAASGENGLHPSVVAKVFSKDNDELIRKNVSENFKSQKILKEMSNDESARVRLAVAKATNNPEVLKAFANDPDIDVRKAAIANGKMPVKIRKEALASLGVKYTKKDEAPIEKVVAPEPAVKIEEPEPKVEAPKQQESLGKVIDRAAFANRLYEAETEQENRQQDFEDVESELSTLKDEMDDVNRVLSPYSTDVMRARRAMGELNEKYKNFDENKESEDANNKRINEQRNADDRLDDAENILREKQKEHEVIYSDMKNVKKAYNDAAEALDRSNKNLKAAKEANNSLPPAPKAEPVQKKDEPVQQAAPAPDFTPAPKVEPIAKQTQQKAPEPKATTPKKSGLPTAPPKAATLTPAQKHVNSMSDIKNSVLKNADEQTARSLSNSGVPTVFDKNFDKMSAAQKEVAVVYTYGIMHKKIGKNFTHSFSEKESIGAGANKDWIAGYNKATPSARKALIKEAHDNIDKALSMSSSGNTKVKEQREASDKRSRETDKYISDFTPKDPAKKKKHDKSMDDLADKMEKGYRRPAGTFSVGGSYKSVEHEGQDFKLHDHSQNNNGERFMRFSVNGDRYEMKRDKTGSWTKPKVSRD